MPRPIGELEYDVDDSGRVTGPTLAAVEPDDGKHKCPYIPCVRRVPSHLFACRAHWMKVPADLRAELYAAYDGRSSRPYHEVRADCVTEMNKR